MKLAFFKNALRAFLFLLSFNVLSQENKQGDQKTRLQPINVVSSIYDSCQLACDLFPSNVDYLISTDNLSFEGIVNESICYKMPPAFEPGCLLNYENQKWVLVKILSGSNLEFDISNSKNYDIDAAIWGPIAEQDLSNTCEALGSFPKSCDYSEMHSILNLTDANAGDYYLMLITNFSNASTNIEIRQPKGGSVKYSYLCPKDINLDSPLDGNQNQNAINSVLLSSGLGDSTIISANSGNSVMLLPGFSTSESVVFKAEIKECLNTSENYTPPSAKIECEDFSNHTSNIPHLYANGYTNELVGTVFAKSTPQYSSDHVNWHDMTKIGGDEGAERYFYAYREEYIKESWVLLRTAPGCPIATDTRSTHPYSYFGEEDTNLWVVPPINEYADIDSPFWMSSDVVSQTTDHEVYALYLKPGLEQLGYRINGQNWRYNTENVSIWEEYNNRFLNVTRINGFSAPKDFIIDFTQDAGATIDRYIVTRNAAGGHFSVTATFNRVADSTVTVQTFQGDMNVKMKLGPYTSTEHFGNCFELGQQEPGDYVYPLTSIKNEYILDENILIRVRFDHSTSY